MISDVYSLFFDLSNRNKQDMNTQSLMKRTSGFHKVTVSFTNMRSRKEPRTPKLQSVPEPTSSSDRTHTRIYKRIAYRKIVGL